MKKLLLTALLLYCGSAYAQYPTGEMQIQDANNTIVGHVGWMTPGPGYLIVTGWTTGCMSPPQTCQAGSEERGLLNFITEGSELWHAGTVYYALPNCSGLGDIHFTLDGDPDPNSTVDARARSAITNDREYALATNPPGSPPTYQSYKAPLGTCVNASGTAPTPASQYRKKTFQRRSWTAPFYVR